MNGGTDLYVQRGDELLLETADYLFDLDTYREIKEIDGRIEIGGSVTVSDLLDSAIMQAYFPKLFPHLKLVSSTPIRNMATVAGNLVNASPIGDITIWLLAMNATVVLQNGTTREIPLRDFYQGYKKMARQPGEIVEKVYFKKPGEHHWFNFEKVSKRRYLDIASVNSAISLEIENGVIHHAHLSAGGVSPVPLFLKNTSSCLNSLPIPFDLAHEEELLYLIQSEIHPISDVRGTAEYKRLLMQQLFKGHFITWLNEHA